MDKIIHTLDSRVIFDERYDSSELQRFIKHPERYLSENDSLKTDKKTSVFKLKLDQHTLIVKRYNVKDALYFLTHCFQKSRAKNCWQAAKSLEKAGIQTPRPIACIEKRFLGLKGVTYYVYIHQIGKRLSETLSSPNQTALCEAIIQTLIKLKNAMISHGDMKATNWLVKDDHIILIDLDATKQHLHKTLFELAHKKDIARFLKNFNTNPLLLDYFRSRLLEDGSRSGINPASSAR